MIHEEWAADRVSGWATLTECLRYRLLLGRKWADGPSALFVMLNPSTADATENDPTIRRCMSFAKRENCGSLEVINLYSLRATDPDRLANDLYPGIPQEAQVNGETLRRTDGPVICAWGAHPMARSQAGYMIDLIRAAGKIPMCLGITKEGYPRHPLYLRKDAALQPYSYPAR